MDGLRAIWPRPEADDAVAQRETNAMTPMGVTDERAAYVLLAKQALGLAADVPALEQWFRDEAQHRRSHGIVKDSKEYLEIVSACARRKSALLRSIATHDAKNGAAVPTTESPDGIPAIGKIMCAG